MGLLDSLFSDDPQKVAQMAMAFGLLGGSPNGRKNFGADLSNAGLLGMTAYGTSKAAQAKLAQEQLQNQLLGLQTKTAQQQYDEGMRARDIIRGGPQAPQWTDTMGDATGGAGGPPQPPQVAPSIVPGVGSKAPVMAASGVPSAGNSKFDTFNKYNAVADKLEQNGLIDQAQKYRDLAEKYRPKLKDEQTRLQGDKAVVVRNYEDGSTEVSPFSPTAKVNYLNTGGQQIGMNEYTGLPTGNALKNSMTPGEVASNNIAAGNLDVAKKRLGYDTGIGMPGGATNLPPAVQAQIAKSQAEGLNTGGIAYKNSLDTTVQTGNDLMTRIAESRNAMEQFKPGMGAEARLNAARAAQALGMPDGLVNAINAGDVSAKQEFQKLSAQQAMETLKSAMGGSGRITQAEFKVFQQNNPNIELDPKAITKIYDFAEKTHRRNVAEQASLNSYLKDGGNISQWPSEWTRRTGGGTPPTSGFRFLGKE
jgi:hypothetical protein